MTTKEFLQQARAKISNDPKTRLSPLTKQSLEDPKIAVDIHTHIFDRKCLSVGYILLRMAKSVGGDFLGLETMGNEMDDIILLDKDEEQIYEDIEAHDLDTEEEWDQLEKELEETIMLNEMYEFLGMDLKDALKVFRKKNMLEILDFYHEHISIAQLDEFKDRKVVTGVLQMDLETGWGIKPKRDFKQQVEDLLDIGTKRPILAYLALDPRRVNKRSKDKNLYEMFLKAFTDPKAPFFGVKCYPSLGYFPSDKRLDPIFEICAEKNIPVLTHCGGETVSTFDRKIKVKNDSGYIDYKLPGKKRVERSRFLSEPGHWDAVLDKHNNLKLCLGHFGGDQSWEDYGKNGTEPRIEKIFSMMQNPDWRVYGDFSFNVIEKQLFHKFKEVMDTRPEILARTLYGTDYWVVLPSGDLLEMQKEFLEKMKDHREQMMVDNMMDYLLG